MAKMVLVAVSELKRSFAAVFVGCLVGAFLFWAVVTWVIDVVLP